MSQQNKIIIGGLVAVLILIGAYVLAPPQDQQAENLASDATMQDASPAETVTVIWARLSGPTRSAKLS
jgi:hypothetical protein